MKTVQFLALLRGINVGGNNLIKMQDLKSCFLKMGFQNVATYIQSGNVLFQSADSNGSLLGTKIEGTLSKAFHYQSRIVLVSHEELSQIVSSAPQGFGDAPLKYRYDVMFIRKPVSAREVMKSVATKAGVDQAFAGKGVVYFSRLIEKAAQSYLSRIIKLPVYKDMTIRNWNTTSKLLALMDARSSLS